MRKGQTIGKFRINEVTYDSNKVFVAKATCLVCGSKNAIVTAEVSLEFDEEPTWDPWEGWTRDAYYEYYWACNCPDCGNEYGSEESPRLEGDIPARVAFLVVHAECRKQQSQNSQEKKS